MATPSGSCRQAISGVNPEYGRTDSTGAIMLSGGGKRGALLPLSKPDTRYWKKVMKAAGAASFEEFRTMPAEKVWTAWKTKNLAGKALQTKPVIDGDLIADKSYDTQVPAIIGTVTKDLLPPVLNHMARAFARRQKKRGVPCFVFSFRRLLPPDGASFHSCDLWYALGSLGRSSRPFTDADRALSDEMVDRFAAFAASGDPNTAKAGGKGQSGRVQEDPGNGSEKPLARRGGAACRTNCPVAEMGKEEKRAGAHQDRACRPSLAAFPGHLRLLAPSADRHVCILGVIISAGPTGGNFFVCRKAAQARRGRKIFSLFEHFPLEPLCMLNHTA